MNVNIPNNNCTKKNLYIKDNCPETCYTSQTCNKATGCKLFTKNKCICKSIQGKRNCQRLIAQKRLGILSNSRNTQFIRQNKPSNIYCMYQKPVYSNNSDMKYYNSVYNKVYNQILTRFTSSKGVRNNFTKQQLSRLKYYASQYTVMWLRKYASSQGPTADGWPATSLNGDNNTMFSEIQDGYSTNCCITIKDKSKLALLKKSLTNPRAFCRISNGNCSGLNCFVLRQLAQKKINA